MATPIGYNWDDIWQDVWQPVWTDLPPVIIEPARITLSRDVTINRVSEAKMTINSAIKTDVEIA